MHRGGTASRRASATGVPRNMNNSYWLANPEQPLTGFSPVIGSEGTDIGLRPPIGFDIIAQRLAGTDGLGGTKFTLEQLQEVMFNNRNYGAELVVSDLVAACGPRRSVTLEDGTVVDLSEACGVLAAWDQKVELDSRGAHLFKEFVRFGGLQFAVPFDPADALTAATDPKASSTPWGPPSSKGPATRKCPAAPASSWPSNLRRTAPSAGRFWPIPSRRTPNRPITPIRRSCIRSSNGRT